MCGISKNIANKYNNIDEFVEFLCSPDEDGRTYVEYGNDPKVYKSRYEHFKQYLKDEFPDFTEEELVKFYNNYQDLKKIFDWFGHNGLMGTLEFEILKQNSDI